MRRPNVARAARTLMRLTRRIGVRFAWYDLWVGAYWDRDRRRLYVCPVPTLAISVDLQTKPHADVLRYERVLDGLLEAREAAGGELPQDVESEWVERLDRIWHTLDVQEQLECDRRSLRQP